MSVMARPKKPKRERKESIIQMRVNAEQKKALAEKARHRGLGLSSWLLSLGMSAPEKPTG
jgi:uncharacterized protein (DUF1778 family)